MKALLTSAGVFDLIVVHGIIVILVGLAVRCPVTAAVASGGGINVKERLFIAIAWLPKATVQV